MCLSWKEQDGQAMSCRGEAHHLHNIEDTLPGGHAGILECGPDIAE